jgi:hypothetical protein
MNECIAITERAAEIVVSGNFESLKNIEWLVIKQWRRLIQFYKRLTKVAPAAWLCIGICTHMFSN